MQNFRPEMRLVRLNLLPSSSMLWVIACWCVALNSPSLHAQSPTVHAPIGKQQTMRIFWNDQGRGIESNAAKSVDLKEALSIWSDELLGVKGNFLGLVDDQDRTIQFYFDQGIPDDVDDATHLRIVHLDFPRPELKGSYEADVTIGEVQGLIRKAFREGADYQRFEKLKFSKW